MVNTSTNRNNKEVSPVRRILVLALVAVAILALTATPALAEGYNGYTFDGSGGITDGPGDYTRPAYEAGPHGGYNSTTNKCQDCHSTHYAAGSYVLLRANSREAACDFCHVGGGGSSINIQMDNTYDATSVESTSSRGMGTGHTLGYSGGAPVDINPAYSDSAGFACFDCHTPHGNSARVLTTFANPGRAFQPTNMVTQPFLSGGADGTAAFIAAGGSWTPGQYDLGSLSVGDGVFWGLTSVEKNIVLTKDVTGVRKTMKKPIWPTGRFLLLKNPDSADATDTLVTTGTQEAGAGAFVGYNKLAIDWDEPLGPADAPYGGDQNADPDAGAPWGSPSGFLSVSEFCTDCHDGAAGASTQPANVWYPDASTNDATGAYTTAYSHDAQPRH